MTLRFGLQSASDLSGKLQRDAEPLAQEVTSDNFFNFVVTGYSLIDWVRHETSTQANHTSPVNHLHEKEWLKICGDIATAAKHHTISIRQIITRDVTANHGFGVGRFGKGSWGMGEEDILIEMADGRTFICLVSVEGVLQTWHSFFTQETENPPSQTRQDEPYCDT